MPGQDSVQSLATRPPDTIESLEEARQRVMGDSSAYRAFESAFYGNDPSQEGGDRLRAGVARFLLGQEGRAFELLKEEKGTLAAYIRARAHLGRGDAARALQELAKVLADCPDCVPARIARAESSVQVGNREQVAADAAWLQARQGDGADAAYVAGLLCEVDGQYEEAARQYQQAAALDPRHHGALFRLAYHESLRGDTETAIELYERLAGMQPACAGALINLGILFEDDEDYQLARNCFQRVLDFDPTHARARLYLADVSASTAQFYDEEKKRNEDKHAAVLNIPVTDFELSVRSRNCLANMNVRTLGDLISLSEQELLAFKNFGETSLTEIKQILVQKGLRLGMIAPKPDSQIGLRAPELIDAVNAVHVPVHDLDLSVRSRRTLEVLGVRTLGDLANLSEAQLLTCKNFGQTSLTEIRKKLESYGLSLKPE